MFTIYHYVLLSRVFYTCEAAAGKDACGVVWRRLCLLICLRRANRNAACTLFVSPAFVCYSNKVPGRCTTCTFHATVMVIRNYATVWRSRTPWTKQKKGRAKQTEAKRLFSAGGQTTCLATALNHLELRSHVWLDQTTSWFLPVPPAIMPRCLAVLVSAGDFLSACTAKTPARGTRSCWVIRSNTSNTSHLFTHTHASRGRSPLPLYTSRPLGPLKSMTSLILRLSRYWLIFPPSGNLGWVSLK